MVQKKIMPEFLLFPNTQPGMGGGHLVRARTLKSCLGDRAVIFEDRISPVDKTGSIKKETAVFDYRETPAALLDNIGTNRYTVGIDEGGTSRESFHYLIDVSMALLSPGTANIAVSPYPLDRTVRRRKPVFPPEKILLAFGSEDRAGLTRRLLDALIGRGLAAGKQITVCEGPRYHEARARESAWPSCVTVVRAPASLQDLLLDNDLVFTHFGLTAYEAVSAGAMVILFNPSGYHRLLSCKAGFPEIGVVRPRTGRLKRFFESPDLLLGFLSRAQLEMEEAKSETLQGIIGRMEPAGLPCCPACGHPNAKAAFRFHDRTYFKCPKCSIFHMISFFGRRKEYTKDYFFNEYSKQYGRTYLEDFEHIKEAGRARIREILKVAGRDSCGVPGTEDKALSLLDVGCAYGPFLQAAKEAGIKPEGMDISPDAVAWVKKELGINAFTGDFSCSVPGGKSAGPASAGTFGLSKKYDIITMWYVIEHFMDLRAVLQRVNRMLPVGGVFAFSTPSYSGVSGMRNLRLFFRASPADHFSIWSKAGARRCLARFGFKVRRIRVTGHHPERFLDLIRENQGDRGRSLKPGSPVFRILGLVSRVLGLGDTFEVYAVKKRNI